MKSCWIFCCFFGLTLGQSQMIDIKCPQNHFLGNIMTNVPSATGFICITCHRLHSAELNSSSSPSLVLCYKNSELQMGLKPIKQTKLGNLTIKDHSLCGVNFFLKNDSMAPTVLINCRKKYLETVSMICPLHSTLSEWSHSKVLHEWCILCEWNRILNLKPYHLCARKSKPDNRTSHIYIDPNNSRCIETNCPKEELKNLSCGYKVSANSTTLIAHIFLASNLIPCHDEFGQAQNLQVSV